MSGVYPDDQFAGLIEAATAAADAHRRDLGKRKRDQEDAYVPVSADAADFPIVPKQQSLSNSAAVLFREPSEKSKKYSRPPLGKVFTSLELAPEAFLKLQNGAKDYMLSDDYPERRDVVGHKKHNGNNDHAKLKLYQCVEGFLHENNNGETFFSHSSNTNDPEVGPRTFFWPEDRGRIIKLLMPLLRKMVTNERQRVYAAETRRSEPKKSESKISKRATSEAKNNEEAEGNPAIEIDPALQSDYKRDASDGMTDTGPGQEPPLASSHTELLNLRVNIVRRDNGSCSRIIPEFVLPSEGIGTFEQFVDGLKKNIDALGDSIVVKAFLPQGLTPIHSEEDWIVAQVTVLAEIWMNAQLQLLIEL